MDDFPACHLTTAHSQPPSLRNAKDPARRTNNDINCHLWSRKKRLRDRTWNVGREECVLCCVSDDEGVLRRAPVTRLHEERKGWRFGGIAGWQPGRYGGDASF